ncbi:hypothetical protein QTN25_006832 [Entamoeba marina]
MKLVALLINNNPECQSVFATTKIPLYRNPIKRILYALDRVVPIALGSPNIDIQLAAHDIFVAYTNGNNDAQLSIASTLLPLQNSTDEPTIGNHIITAFLKKDNMKEYIVASMLLSAIFKNPLSRYVFRTQLSTDDERSFLTIFCELIMSTEDRTKALMLLRLLVVITVNADNDFLLSLMNDSLLSYLLLKSADADVLHSALASLVLLNVLNELKCNSAPNSNTAIIAQLDRAINTIGFDHVTHKLSDLQKAKEFVEASQNGISSGLLFDKEAVKFIEEIIGGVQKKWDSGEKNIKVREVEMLNEKIEELMKKEKIDKQSLTDALKREEELKNQILLLQSFNNDLSQEEFENEKNQLIIQLKNTEESLKEKDVQYKELLNSYTKLQTQVDGQKIDNTLLHEELKNAQSVTEELKHTKNELTSYKDSQEIVEKELEELKEQAKKLSSEIHIKDTAIDELETTVKNQQVVIDQLNQSEKSIEEELNISNKYSQSLEGQCNELKNKINELNSLLNEANDQILQLNTTSKETKSTNEQTSILQKQITEKDELLEHYKTEQTKLLQKVTELTKENDTASLQQQLKEVQSEKEQFENELEMKSDELMLSQMQVEEFSNVNDELNAETTQLKETIKQLTEQLQSYAQNNFDVLDSFTEKGGDVDSPQQPQNSDTTQNLQSPKNQAPDITMEDLYEAFEL